MKLKVILPVFALFCLYTSAWAQKKTDNSNLSNAEKMGYARTNKYWGPGTYYLYAPGTPINKMANNAISAMRDLTGISETDFYTELGKQGFVEVPRKEVKLWFNANKSKDKKFFYAPDKSYILQQGMRDMEKSAAGADGYSVKASANLTKFVLVPLKDSAKVMDAIYQFLRDMNEMKVQLGSYGSTFKKADPKAYPIQQAGTTGWTGLRAGTFVLKMVDGKPKGYWQCNEDIVRRNLGKPEFKLEILASETDFAYGLTIKLLKEGYVLNYYVLARNLSTLEPGSNWAQTYPTQVAEYKAGIKGDKDAVDTFKKSPLPPVLEDLDKILHLK